MDSPMHDSLLWHYTDINGLLGILPKENSLQGDLSFHASTTYGMNDHKEIEFGFSIFEAALKEEFANEPNVDKAPGACIQTDYIDPILWQIRKWDTLNIFSVSFSRARDRLSQWRGYANGGYALGLDEATLERGILLGEEAPGRRFRFKDVSYLRLNRDENVPAIRNDSSFIKVADSIRAMTPIEQVLDQIYHTIMMEIPFWKSESFSEEEEVRFVISANSPINYRPSTLGPRAYMECTVPLSALKTVMVGPGANEDERFTTTNRFILDRTSGEAYASPSSVTLRS